MAPPALGLALDNGRGSVLGDGPLAAQMGVQQAVRQHCLSLRRAQQSAGAGGQGKGSMAAVPLVRRVCAVYPREVDLEICVHVGVCEVESADGGSARMGVREQDRDLQRGRDVFLHALAAWLLRRLGFKDTRAPLALESGESGPAVALAAATGASTAIAS